jgi:hypothetical protein
MPSNKRVDYAAERYSFEMKLLNTSYSSFLALCKDLRESGSTKGDRLYAALATQYSLLKDSGSLAKIDTVTRFTALVREAAYAISELLRKGIKR